MLKYNVCTIHVGLHGNRLNFYHSETARKFCGGSICYYPNSDACFQVSLLQDGDINPNPGPVQELLGRHIESPMRKSITYYRDQLCDISHNNICHQRLPPTSWRTLTSLVISCRKRTRRGEKIKNRSTFSPPVIQRNSDQLPACFNIDSSLNQSRFDSSAVCPRNSSNLIDVCSRFYTRPDCMAKSYYNTQLCVGLWNARSMNNKTTSICDLTLGKNL